MKTLKNTFLNMLVGALTLVVANPCYAQMSDHRFQQLFEQAFDEVLTGNYLKAIPTLKQLNSSDRRHGQVAYLLGMCYMKQTGFAEEAEQLLTVAVDHYNYYHQRGRVDDRSAPAKAWFYLAEAQMQLGKHDKAIETYRNYMSCIPMASLDAKREVIERIRQAKGQLTHASQKQVASEQLLATLQP